MLLVLLLFFRLSEKLIILLACLSVDVFPVSISLKFVKPGVNQFLYLENQIFPPRVRIFS